MTVFILHTYPSVRGEQGLFAELCRPCRSTQWSVPTPDFQRCWLNPLSIFPHCRGSI